MHAETRETSVDDRIAALTASQDGALARRQLREMGVSRSVVRGHLRGRRWQRVHPGVFVTFTGPLPPRTRIWAAVLYAGTQAVVSHRTAAWLSGLRPDLPATVDVTVPHGYRHPASRAGVRVRQSRRYGDRAQRGSSPPRTRVEDTVLDLCDELARREDVVDLLLTACQKRLTTAARLRDAARKRSRMRWRVLAREVLADVVDGVQSELERRYRNDVERAHGLPRGTRNAQEGRPGRRRYRDVRYRRWHTVVELDGRGAHPDHWRERDDMRDNELLAGENTRTLRYGWRSVAGTPCATAAQVARVLQAAGWPGSLRSCGPRCTAVPTATDVA